MLRYLMVRSWSCGGTVNMQDLIDKRAHTYSPRSKNVSHSCNACAGRMSRRSRCLALTMCMTPISASATLPQNRNEDAHRPRPSATLWIARADREGDMSGDREEVSYGRPCCPSDYFRQHAPGMGARTAGADTRDRRGGYSRWNGMMTIDVAVHQAVASGQVTARPMGSCVDFTGTHE
jgi:hypothetical protein